jgi:hypothetical protein
MTRVASAVPRTFSVITLLLALLLPTAATAGWGEANWGEMVWGAVAIPVPSLSIRGLIALAALLGFVSATLLARHRRGARP